MTVAVVFDLDGTLVDSTGDIAAAINRTLARRGLEPLPDAAVRAITGYGADELVRRAFGARGVPLAADELRAETERYLGEYDRRPVERTVVCRDAAGVLAELRRRGVRTGVCTNKETALARTVLDALGLDVDVVVGVDAVERRKPDPAHLLAVLDRLGVRPAEALYVGDTTIDADTARAAGVPCALVAWGLGRNGGARRIARFAELLDDRREAT